MKGWKTITGILTCLIGGLLPILAAKQGWDPAYVEAAQEIAPYLLGGGATLGFYGRAKATGPIAPQVRRKAKP